VGRTALWLSPVREGRFVPHAAGAVWLILPLIWGRVFPEVPIRQWVLSLPFVLRYGLVNDSRLVRGILHIFIRVVLSSLRRRGSHTVHGPAGIPGKRKKGRDEEGEGALNNGHPRNFSWSELMLRVVEIDILKCDRCGGRMRILSHNLTAMTFMALIIGYAFVVPHAPSAK
jgi:hypothetical protein